MQVDDRGVIRREACLEDLAFPGLRTPLSTSRTAQAFGSATQHARQRRNALASLCRSPRPVSTGSADDEIERARAIENGPQREEAARTRSATGAVPGHHRWLVPGSPPRCGPRQRFLIL